MRGCLAQYFFFRQTRGRLTGQSRVVKGGLKVVPRLLTHVQEASRVIICSSDTEKAPVEIWVWSCFRVSHGSKISAVIFVKIHAQQIISVLLMLKLQ